MAEQARNVFTKEYRSSGGVLIVENRFDNNRPKSDVIVELITSGDYPRGENPARPAGGLDTGEAGT